MVGQMNCFIRCRSILQLSPLSQERIETDCRSLQLECNLFMDHKSTKIFHHGKIRKINNRIIYFSNFYFLPFDPFFTDFFFAAINLPMCHVQYIRLVILIMTVCSFFLRNKNFVIDFVCHCQNISIEILSSSALSFLADDISLKEIKNMLI